MYILLILKMISYWVDDWKLQGISEVTVQPIAGSILYVPKNCPFLYTKSLYKNGQGAWTHNIKKLHKETAQ